ncbi:MAG: toll/interleukin-1 receptor domain-containing protein [Fidelibacterota bacterium]|nr:MAG: toll/interleukin-1 receptor domain-containing protein [Candidatus Neomarinimicrobiota bacterium]
MSSIQSPRSKPVRNNRRLVQRFCDDLTNHGVKVWLDRRDIEPGVDWKQAIRRAIGGGAFFIACFSKQYEARRMEEQGTWKNIHEYGTHVGY